MAGLSTGAIAKGLSQEDLSAWTPTLQVIEIEQTAQAKKYRAIVSDGEHYVRANLSTELSRLVEDQKLVQYQLLKINECVSNMVKGAKMLVLIDAEAVEGGPAQLIGKPKKYEAPPAKKAAPVKKVGERAHQPIASLNPYQGAWTIKARVTRKDTIRDWSNARGNGKLFGIDLLDSEGGQISATFFNEAADKFFPIMQEKKVYYFSRGSLSVANRKFNSLPNDYKVTFNEDADIELAGEDTDISEEHWSFTTIDALPQVEVGEYVDIVGIVTKVSPLADIQSSKTDRQLTKRTITLADKSLLAIDLTLWNDQATLFDEDSLQNNPVLAIKGSRVSDFGGRSLNSGFSSNIQLDPKVAETAKLKEWWEEKGKDATFECISVRGGSGGGRDPRKRFADVEAEQLGFQAKPDYFTVLGTIIKCRSDFEKPPWYNACTTPDCNKKVNDEGHCAKCNKSSAAPVQRYILSINAADGSGSQWLTAFDDVAQQLVKHKAAKVKTLIDDNDKKGFEKVFSATNFCSYNFKVRAQAGPDKNGDLRLRCTIVAASKVDFKRESRTLLEEINAGGAVVASPSPVPAPKVVS